MTQGILRGRQPRPRLALSEIASRKKDSCGIFVVSGDILGIAALSKLLEDMRRNHGAGSEVAGSEIA